MFMCVYQLFLYCVFLCFFFFKQKTAYEMRISDWSSDVCSSDLTKLKERVAALQMSVDATVGSIKEQLLSQQKEVASQLSESSEETNKRLNSLKIGRASCRERVCQYV